VQSPDDTASSFDDRSYALSAGDAPPAQPDPKGYRTHSRLWRENRYVYPVLSRRSRGLSIGINLNPDQTCNFNCAYCQVDRQHPAGGPQIAVDRLSVELDALLALAADGAIWDDPLFADAPPALRRVNDIAFSGDGEPTLCPKLAEVVRLSRDAKRAGGLDGVKLVLITNASLLHRPGVQEALRLLAEPGGEVWAKLDAGTPAYFRRVARTPVPFQRILDNIADAARHVPLVVQSLFMRIDGQGPDAAEITAYAHRLRDVLDAGGRIDHVQIYTIARPPREASVTALDPAELDTLADAVRDITALPVMRV